MRIKTIVIAVLLCAFALPAFAKPTAAPDKGTKVIDPVWNGVLIGAGAGAVGAWIFTRAECGPRGYDNECSAIATIAGAAIFIPSGMLAGGIIDRLINKTLPPSASSHAMLAPTLSRRDGRTGAGLKFSLRVRF